MDASSVPILVAVIAAIASMGAATVSLYSQRLTARAQAKAQQELEAFKAAKQHELETVKANSALELVQLTEPLRSELLVRAELRKIILPDIWTAHRIIVKGMTDAIL